MAHPGQPSQYVLAGAGAGVGDDASSISASQLAQLSVVRIEVQLELDGVERDRLEKGN
jgi:hypothetical protein